MWHFGRGCFCYLKSRRSPGGLCVQVSAWKWNALSGNRKRDYGGNGNRSGPKVESLSQKTTFYPDHRSTVAFMLNRKRTKIKDNKMQYWRLQLASFSYSILNTALVKKMRQQTPWRALFVQPLLNRNLSKYTRVCVTLGLLDYCILCELRIFLSQQGTSRGFVRPAVRAPSWNPDTFVLHAFESKLMKATQPFESVSVDFEWHLPASSRNNKNLLTTIDVFWRFFFAFACPNMYSTTVINCFWQQFSFCAMPSFIHSDNQSSFVSKEDKEYFTRRGIAMSKSAPHHPMGNSQVERYYGVLWNAIWLVLKSRDLPITAWQSMLPDALFSNPYCVQRRTRLCMSSSSTFRDDRRTANRYQSGCQAQVQFFFGNLSGCTRMAIWLRRSIRRM